METNATDLLFHYCSNETFVSICKNRSIRLSSMLLSNDWSEGMLLPKVLSETVENRNLDRDMIENLLNEIAFRTPFLECLATCFSEDADHLGQWINYADNGEGVAIGFDKKFLEQLAVQMTEGDVCHNYVGIRKVAYSSEDQKTLIARLADATIARQNSDFDELFEKYHDIRSLYDTPKFKESPEHIQWRRILTDLILEVQFLLKDEGFNVESEWRLFEVRATSGLSGKDKRGSI